MELKEDPDFIEKYNAKIENIDAGVNQKHGSCRKAQIIILDRSGSNDGGTKKRAFMIRYAIELRQDYML